MNVQSFTFIAKARDEICYLSDIKISNTMRLITKDETLSWMD
jgi:hypothetical protein